MSHIRDLLPGELPFNGDWFSLEELAYNHFHETFLRNKPKFRGDPVFVDLRQDPDTGREEGFYHLTTRGKGNERKAEIQRATKILWVDCLIDNYQADGVRYWEYLEGGNRTRHYIWAEEQDFVVILEEKSRGFYLVTGFVTDNGWKRKDLARKYKNRKA